MACIFPGARDLAAYWRNIALGVDATHTGGGFIDAEQAPLRSVIDRAMLDAQQGRQRRQAASGRGDGPGSVESVRAERMEIVGDAVCAVAAIDQVVRSLRDRRCDLGVAAAAHLPRSGAVVCKRLSDAEEDGDRIYAVVRGVGVAGDGHSAGSVLAMRRK